MLLVSCVVEWEPFACLAHRALGLTSVQDNALWARGPRGVTTWTVHGNTSASNSWLWKVSHVPRYKQQDWATDFIHMCRSGDWVLSLDMYQIWYIIFRDMWEWCGPSCHSTGSGTQQLSRCLWLFMTGSIKLVGLNTAHTHSHGKYKQCTEQLESDNDSRFARGREVDKQKKSDEHI